MGGLTPASASTMRRDEFVAAFAGVYEDSPHLAAAAWARRPFASVADVQGAFAAAADDLDDVGVLTLLRAHPELGAHAPMAAASTSEQRGAGLDRLEEQRRARLAAANAEYRERFGFPFVIAVAGLGPDEVEVALAERLGHDEPTERATALAQVQRIAALRLDRLLAP